MDGDCVLVFLLFDIVACVCLWSLYLIGDSFKRCLIGIFYMQDNKVLTTTERLIAFALLVEAYSSQNPASNPFISFIINVSYLLHCYILFCLIISLLGTMLFVQILEIRTSSLN